MGLADRYKALTGATPTPAAPAAAEPATVPPAASKPPSTGGRDLAAIRAKLAAGGGGGVNPPEMAEALKPEAFEPKTTEAPDGEPQPIEPAPSAGSTTPAATPGAPATAKRTRRTRAQIEADEKAEALFKATVAAAGAASEGKDVPPEVKEVLRAHGELPPDPPPPTMAQLVEALRRLVPEGTHLVIYGSMPF